MVCLRYFIFANLTFLPFTALAQEVCTPGGQIPLVSATNIAEVQMMRDAALAASSSDLPKFCAWNRMDRLAEHVKNKSTYRELKAEGNLEKAEAFLKENVNPEELSNPWLSSMAGTPALKSMGVDSRFSEHYDPAKIASALHANEKNNNFRLPGRTAFPIPQPAADIERACDYMGASPQKTCAQAVKDLAYFARMNITKSPIVALKTFEKVVRDPAMKLGLFTAADLALKQRLTEPSANSNHFFDDTVQAFKSHGNSDSAAKDRAWDAAYLYSVGGANFSHRAEQEVDSKTEINANVIGTQALLETLVKNDSQFVGKNLSPYSLPQRANFPCDSGKSYHFWMTGYFARFLKAKGYSQEMAAKVAYMAAVAYQIQPIKLYGMMSDYAYLNSTSRKAPTDAARFGTIENGNRIDLNMAAAGAIFGASDGTKLKDMSQGFRESMLYSDSSPNVGTDDSKSKKPSRDSNQTTIDRLNPRRVFEYYAN